MLLLEGPWLLRDVSSYVITLQVLFLLLVHHLEEIRTRYLGHLALDFLTRTVGWFLARYRLFRDAHVERLSPLNLRGLQLIESVIQALLLLLPALELLGWPWTLRLHTHQFIYT
jgi:hypothetical protein